MVNLRIDTAQPDHALISRAAAVLRAGGIVAYPTDTFYGLAANPAAAATILQLYRIKGRQVDQAVPLIAADVEQVEACAGKLDRLARTLAERFWPGPLTIVIPAWAGLADALHAGTGTVAIRVPGHPTARALAAACGWPITSTSANRSGDTPPTTAEAVRLALGRDLDAILDGGALPGGRPSTIVDVTGREPRLVRAGAVPWERVLECLSDRPPPGVTP
jgi:L-threonylcarbamoyladenylate synthase